MWISKKVTKEKAAPKHQDYCFSKKSLFQDQIQKGQNYSNWKGSNISEAKKLKLEYESNVWKAFCSVNNTILLILSIGYCYYSVNVINR
jgi:hypothetical protein